MQARIVHIAGADVTRANRVGLLTDGVQAFTATLDLVRSGKDTAPTQIVKMVQDAIGSQATIARRVDVVSSYVVPAVMIASLLTFLVWFNFGLAPALAFAMVTAVTVLIIACPCAVGIAVPMSMVAGAGKGAEHGVLIRNGEALQGSSKLDVLVLDKTGTITKGKPALTEARPALGFEDDELLRLGAAADTLKEDSVEAIRVMKEIGLEIVMLTGDNERTARAIGTGTDGAIEAANVTLMSGSLTGVAYAFEISKATMRNDKQSLFGAFVYNTLGIPVAAGVLYPFFGLLLSPVIAGAAMAASSETVSVEFTTEAPGEISFQYQMGMLRGNVVVTR